MDVLETKVKQIRTLIAPYNPKIVAVTKYSDESAIIKSFNLGLRCFGENRVQDAITKMDKLPENILKQSEFHLIGHLQTNKVKYAVGRFELIHSVDSYKIAKAISDEAKRKNIIQKVLLQINNAHEEQKYGFYPEELYDCFESILSLTNIQVLGVMNIAPLNCSNDELRSLFKNIKHINDDLSLKHGVNLKEISMGMSNDFQIALEEGATIIRLGRILYK